MLEDAKARRIEQKIGEIEVDRLKPSPPFNNVTVDLAGPFRIKYKEKKVWSLIYLCNNSKALHLQTVENYTAKAVTTALNNVFGVRNLPSKITSDAGKNIGKSRRLFVDTSNKGFTQEDLTVFKEAWPQIEWAVIPPDAPHRVGGAEAMVKTLKRSLRYFPTSSLSIMEFDCALKQIASTVNNRPLGVLTTEDSILTPNQLILGRNYDPTHPGPEVHLDVLLPHVRNIVNNWFDRWNNTVVPEMFKVSRW